MTTNSDNTLIVILGPTGSGKTDLSIKVARRFCSPIISADSRQFYKGMAIGTAQPMPEQLAAVPHYFIANAQITDEYTAGRYEREALALLEKLFAGTPIVVAVGGSGLYIDALCNGMDSLPKSEPGLRRELTRRLEENGLQDLLIQLRELDPVYYEKVDRTNPKRVMRALEVCLQTGKPYSSLRSGQKAARPFRIIKIGTDMPRDILYDRINRRVDMMVAAGLEDEARTLYTHRRLNSLQTVGYREFFDYFDGTVSRDEAIELIKRNSRRYAKRQMTWFRRDESTVWFDPADTEGVIRHIESVIV